MELEDIIILIILDFRIHLYIFMVYDVSRNIYMDTPKRMTSSIIK